MEEKFVTVFSTGDFRKWLAKNHDKIKKVGLLIHKKHTGKPSPSHKELMHEAICFGWIDTTLKRIDEDTYVRFFARRSKNSKWSYNTLSYAKQLIKEKRMTPHGLKFYQEGLKKKPHDYGIPRSPEVPEEMRKLLSKYKIAKANFEKLSPSTRKTYLRWVYRAKRPETKMKRILEVVRRMKAGNVKIDTSLKVND